MLVFNFSCVLRTSSHVSATQPDVPGAHLDTLGTPVSWGRDSHLTSKFPRLQYVFDPPGLNLQGLISLQPRAQMYRRVLAAA